jgi:uncharacterized protein (DUF1800 family)
MVTPYSESKFARRVGFGLKPGQQIKGDPVGWALAQLRSVPPIDIYDGPGGLRRRDLPDDVQLYWDNKDVMKALAGHFQAFGETPRKVKSLSPQAAQKLRREAFGPFTTYEHWKETQARATTAVYGAAPVFERLWHFWTNYFTVAPAPKLIDVLVGPFQRRLRLTMTGSFRDMLWGAVTDAGMLFYLDNDKNAGPNSDARRSGKTTYSTNENLGREMMELFTLSPSAGYTQQDVEQATLILTGWRVELPVQGHRGFIGALFDPNFHEPGTQSVMGKTYKDSARSAGKLADLVTDLALHPATARHVAVQLCTYFIADSPPPEAVAHVEKAFLSSKGDLPSVHKALIEMCWSSIDSTRKFLNPETWLWQSISAMQGGVPRTTPWDPAGGVTTLTLLSNIGQAIPYTPQPNGWPIKSDGWISREMLDRRARSSKIIGGRKGDADLATLTAQLVEWNIPPESPTRVVLNDVSDPIEAKQLFLLSPEMLWS